MVAAGCAAGCVQPLDWSWVCSSVHSPDPPVGRRVGSSFSMDTPDRPLLFVCRWNSCSQHAFERPIRICDLQSTGSLLEPVFVGSFTALTWSFSRLPCDGNHKATGRRVAFR